MKILVIKLLPDKITSDCLYCENNVSKLSLIYYTYEYMMDRTSTVKMSFEL